MGPMTMLAMDLLDLYMEIKQTTENNTERELTQTTDNLAKVFNQLFAEEDKEKQTKLVTSLLMETFFIISKKKISLNSILQEFTNRKRQYFCYFKQNLNRIESFQKFFEV